MTAATRGSRARFLEQRVVDPATLTPYPGNPNIGDVEAVRASLRANGQYRTPVTRRLPDGGLQVLAGHTTRLAAIAEAMPLRVDVVDADDKTARRIVLADNRTAQLSHYDEDLLLAILDGGDLEGTGWDQAAYEELLQSGGPGDDGPAYTQAVNIPQYEVVGPEPPVSELRDETRADQLRARILEAADKTPLPADVRDYLLAAAARHTVFDYRKAAEFYPHASAEVQALMEESALVIIDIGDAIRLGYAKLMDTLTDLRERDEESNA